MMFKFIFQFIWAPLFLWVLHIGPEGIAPIGNLIDPLRGLYHNARITEHKVSESIILDFLDHPVTIERDERGVPHIFASSDRDAIIALGFVSSQDRLFQMDFISRVAAGRLSEIFGPNSIETDQFLRSTGMRWASLQIMDALAEEESLDYEIMTWFADGANAYINNLSYAEWPIEFKLFNYTPEQREPLHTVLMVQYFNYDLGFGTDDPAYSMAYDRLGSEDYSKLYPRESSRFVPIIPDQKPIDPVVHSDSVHVSVASPGAMKMLTHMHQTLRDHGIEGYWPSKGSNNWGVSGSKSTTGSVMLAGDMHLGLTLPSIWYEVHMVTPTMNTYGVLAPGTPIPIEAYNDYVGWAFTNSHIDVIDFYHLQISDDQRSYQYDGEWLPLQWLPDTIAVKGQDAFVDTLKIAHMGPVVEDSTHAVAIQWVAHQKNYMMSALWDMNHARSAAQLDSALMKWHAPSQNILFGDVYGNLGIRVAGMVPIRASGEGIGLLDGTTSNTAWIGTIPFEQLPHSINPDQGYLASTNQPPFSEPYPYYLNQHWEPAYRSLRINELLSEKDQHSFNDVLSYQGDIYVGQYDAFVPHLQSVNPRTPEGEQVKQVLMNWDGYATVESKGTLALYEYLATLKRLTWDEPLFDGIPLPNEIELSIFLEEGSKWFDLHETPEIEDAEMIMALALDETGQILQDQYGDDWTWGRHHKILFRHLTQTDALDILWRGPYSYPGFNQTLGPADGMTVTSSASWRVGVDFSQQPPVGSGIYAGGQSGSPLSDYYDLQILDYVNYQTYPLHKPQVPGELNSTLSTVTLVKSH